MAGRPRTVTMLAVALGVVLVLVAAAGIFAVWLLSQETTPVDLKLRLQPGKSYAFRLEASHEAAEGAQEGAGGSLLLEYTFQVESVDERGNAKVNVTCDRVSLREGGPQSRRAYDSAGDTSQAPEELKLIGEMLNRGFSMTVSPMARVLALKGAESPTDEDASLLGRLRTLMSARVEGQQSQELLKGLIEESLAIYPPGPVAIGSSWRRGPSGTGDPASQGATLRLKSRRGGVATISVESQMEFKEAKLPGPRSAKMKGSGSQRGSFRVEEASGCIKEGTVESGLHMEIEIGGTKQERSTKGLTKVGLVEKAQ